MIFNYILAASGILGFALGNLGGGRLCSKVGMWRLTLISFVLSFGANLLKMILFYPTLVIGKFLVGYGSGILCFIYGKA